MRKIITILLLLIFAIPIEAQTQVPEATIEKLNQLFADYTERHSVAQPVSIKSVKPSTRRQTVDINVSDGFGFNDFTLKDVRKLYKKASKALPKEWRRYKVRIYTCGSEITTLCPESALGQGSMAEGWGNIDYHGRPWTENESRPSVPTLGLEGRHIALWASHGRYYDATKDRWKWQRPALFGTTEDLFTQSIVVPYLIPMLQNAGANVFTPRERDWQKNEVIVDNDDRSVNYTEYDGDGDSPWVKAPQKGFKKHSGTYIDGENPFTSGTARMNITTDKERRASTATYQPLLPEDGRYAVYVSYQTVDGSIDNAEYIVYHKGVPTVYKVNQQMGGGTWVYLGTFEFEAGCSPRNRVVVSNLSEQDGLVTTDAVRFGGGMGNIERGNNVSGLPRSMEGARYYAQWAGAPYSVYSFTGGDDDYKDDINTRSLMTNWIAGGSPFVPSTVGKRVPIELSLAVHSDAGYSPSTSEAIGTLAICTTNYNDGRLAAGCSRQMSADFAKAIIAGIAKDICRKFPTWTTRGIWDKNYSESRLPGVPSAICETMSHQNPADLFLGHDPNFKFLFARSLYKTILRYVSAQHGQPCVVEPLPPSCFRASQMSHGSLRLAWNSTPDDSEPTAAPTSYILYTAVDNNDFDNGTLVKDTTFTLQLEPSRLYRFHVTASNRGGESFPSATLAASYASDQAPTILIVDGFSRVAPPQIVDNDSQRGFDLVADMGVSYGLASEWIGRQQNFDASRGGSEGERALGYTDTSLMGSFVMGNQMDNAAAHAQLIHAAGQYNITSCTIEAMEHGYAYPANSTRLIDFAFGLQKSDGSMVKSYTTFGPTTRRIVEAYEQRGGSVLSSGAYLMSDMTTPSQQAFASTVLCSTADGTYDTSLGSVVTGLGTSFVITTVPNPYHFACQHADVIAPTANAFAAMQYSDGRIAAVACNEGPNRVFTMGFPLECITDMASRKAITKGIINFLLK